MTASIRVSSILLEYDDVNEKYYLYIDCVMVGKHYNIPEAIRQMKRETGVE
jgi:hypothetical protein